MNETIKKGLIEIHNFDQSDMPVILYFDVKKYRNVPFLINKHVDLELLFVREGEIEMHLDDAVFGASHGNIVVANSNVLHNIIPVTESVKYECMIIDRDFCEKYGFLLEHNHIQEIIDERELFERIDRIKDVVLRQDDVYRVAEVTAEVLQLLAVLFGRYSISVNGGSEYGSRVMLEKGLEYIHEHFREQIDVEMIARHAGYSKFYFCRKFKEITGCTVNTYVNMRRISYAKELLMNGNRSVYEVATECGFNNLAYFSQIFRKYVRRSPGEYKRIQKNTKEYKKASAE